MSITDLRPKALEDKVNKTLLRLKSLVEKVIGVINYISRKVFLTMAMPQIIQNQIDNFCS